MKKVKLSISGMSCAACSSSIQKSLSRKKHINSAEIDLVSESGVIEYDESKITLESILLHINKLGYSAEIFKDDKRTETINEYSNYHIALGFGIVLFVVSMGSMFFSHINEIALFCAELALLIPIIYAGKNIFIKGIISLFKLVPTMDTLVSLGSISAIVYSFYALLLHILNGSSLVHNIYLESAGVIIAVIMLGKNFEFKATNGVKLDIGNLTTLTTNTTLRQVGSNILEVPLREINVNDIIVINKGVMIGADSILLDEKCKVDESLITGESKHKTKHKGEQILSGSVNVGEQFRAKVLRIQAESLMGKIITLMQEVKKAPIARIADTVSYYFVPSVIIIAICSTIFWYINTYDFHIAFVVFTSVLLISCPCALGLATPLSILVATSISAKKAIYFKNAQSIEFTSKLNMVVFDKTGTLTKGELEVKEFEINKDNNIDKNYLLSLIYNLECKSEHIIAQAITKYIKGLEYIGVIKQYECHNVHTHTGLGINAIIDNMNIKIGSARFIQNTPEVVTSHLTCFVSVEDKYAGYFIITDTLRENAKLTVSNLTNIGIESVIVSGDCESNVKSVAEMCGISNYYHSQLPNDKLSFIQSAQERGVKVAFIGDGVNDVLAIKKADIGFSLCNANDLAIKNADVVLLSNNLNSLYEAIIVSKKTLRNIKENLGFAFIYNICAIPVACGVFYGVGISLNPMISSIAMGASSLSVVLNAMRLRQAKI